MSRNGSGTYNLPSGNPVVSGTTISSTWANSTLSDIATALTGSIASDGQTPVTGNLNMGNNKITAMADGSNATDACNYGQLVDAVAGVTSTLGTMATQNSSNVSITGGTITGNYGLNSAGIYNASGWTVSQSGTKLYFAYNGVNKASLDSSGNFIAIGNVTAYGTP